MKKRISIVAMLTLIGLACWMYFAPRIRIDLAARNNDPAKMDLLQVPLMHKSIAKLPNKIECGVIHLGDSSLVRFWFISRHVQPGLGLTRFDFPDGDSKYLRGAFCCEVSVDEGAIDNKESLLRFIIARNGTEP